MPNRRLIEELKKLLRERGIISRVQREYAKAEEQAMLQIHPMTKPGEETRFSHLRTLQSYIGDCAVHLIREQRENMHIVEEGSS